MLVSLEAKTPPVLWWHFPKVPQQVRRPEKSPKSMVPNCPFRSFKQDHHKLFIALWLHENKIYLSYLFIYNVPVLLCNTKYPSINVQFTLIKAAKKSTLPNLHWTGRTLWGWRLTNLLTNRSIRQPETSRPLTTCVETNPLLCANSDQFTVISCQLGTYESRTRPKISDSFLDISDKMCDCRAIFCVLILGSETWSTFQQNRSPAPPRSFLHSVPCASRRCSRNKSREIVQMHKLRESTKNCSSWYPLNPKTILNSKRVYSFGTLGFSYSQQFAPKSVKHLCLKAKSTLNQTSSGAWGKDRRIKSRFRNGTKSSRSFLL